MLIRPYDYDIDQHHAIAMLASNGMSRQLFRDLPKFGLIAFENNIPIAMGFARRIEGDYAMLDSYITFKGTSPELRDKALDRITAKLYSIASYYEIRALFAFSVQQTIIDRAKRHGFVDMCSPMLILKTN